MSIGDGLCQTIPDWVEIEPGVCQHRVTGEKMKRREDGKWELVQQCSFDEEYFLRGQETGKSLYKDYRWLPDLTIPMVRAIISHCDIDDIHSILDFGCARGYVVKAFREMGYEAYGVDVSEWAIKNCDSAVSEYIRLTNGVPISYDWVLAKDVLEHVPQVCNTIDDLLDSARVGLFAVVPLSLMDGTLYTIPEYEKDVTHIHRLCLASWVKFFLRPGWEVTASYRVKGIKDNYAKWEYGNGFITCRRLANG